MDKHQESVSSTGAATVPPRPVSQTRAARVARRTLVDVLRVISIALSLLWLAVLAAGIVAGALICLSVLLALGVLTIALTVAIAVTLWALIVERRAAAFPVLAMLLPLGTVAWGTLGYCVKRLRSEFTAESSQAEFEARASAGTVAAALTPPGLTAASILEPLIASAPVKTTVSSPPARHWWTDNGTREVITRHRSGR